MNSQDKVAVVVYQMDRKNWYRVIIPPGAIPLAKQNDRLDGGLKSIVVSEMNRRQRDRKIRTYVRVQDIIDFADQVSPIEFRITDPAELEEGTDFLENVGGFATQTAFFFCKLPDLRRLGWKGMGDVDSSINQWNREYIAEESAANTAKNLSLFGSVACVSLLFVLLDTTFLRDTAAKVDKSMYDDLKQGSPERQRYYDKLARLQDADITSTTRVLLLMLGVTAYMVLWSEVIAQARFKFVANAVAKTRPIVLNMVREAR